MVIDFIIIDVHMPEISGIDVINALSVNYDVPVVYVTSYTENWPDTRVHFESGYLVKPFSQETFNNTISVVLGRRNETYYFEYAFRTKNEDDTFSYNQGKIPCNRILCFTVIGHDVEMITVDGVKHLSGAKLKNIFGELAGHGFFLCHRSYLINLRYYQDHNKTDATLLVINEQMKVPLARKRINALEDAIMDYKTRGKYAF
jgi:DNA-binding LytR/AlgR family response regulator